MNLSMNLSTNFSRWFLITFVFINFVSSVYAGQDLSFPSGKDCVSWKTRKVLGLFKTVEPVGLNCEITVNLKNQSNGLKTIEVTVPITKFDSKEPERDKEVARILGAESEPNLVITSIDLDYRKFEASEKPLQIDAKLSFGGKSYQVVAETLRKPDRTYQVLIKTNFTQLGLKPPSVFGGLVAKVSDVLELRAQIQDRKEFQ